MLVCRSLRMILTAAVLSVALLGGSQTSAIAAPAIPAPAPAPYSTSGKVGLKSTGDRTASSVCFFTTNGDYVHRSGSDASGHGWWVNGNCRATFAVVTVQLQEYYSDGSWRNKGAPGRRTVRSGGGRGNRATGRAGCNNSSVTGWRSVIDVDVVGVADDPRKLTTPGRNISCRRF